MRAGNTQNKMVVYGEIGTGLALKNVKTYGEDVVCRRTGRLVRRLPAGAFRIGCSCGDVVVAPCGRGLASGLFELSLSRRDRVARTRSPVGTRPSGYTASLARPKGDFWLRIEGSARVQVVQGRRQTRFFLLLVQLMSTRHIRGGGSHEMQGLGVSVGQSVGGGCSAEAVEFSA